ncbi:MAG: flagellar filament capping protein FliD [Candidatus Cloacimonetes bacterium]|nr:flagellar filament capping protein FliD [Candidatus Cloacimonadota bacterium]
MSGDLKISGLASGIPFDELITQMLDAERFQAKKLEEWRKTWEVKIDTLRDLSSRVSSLQTVNNSLRIASSFISRLASSTDTRVADITVDSSANIGNIQLDVAGQVNHRIGSTGFRIDDVANPPLVENTGILSFSVGNSGRLDIDLSLEDDPLTLNELVGLINNEHGSHVTASIETVGSVSRLVMTSNTAGQNGSVKIIEDTTELSFQKTSMDSSFITNNSNNQSETFESLTVGGEYTGHVSKMISFTVENSGTETNEIRIRWEDPQEGRVGVITIPDGAEAGDEFDVMQGITLKLPDDFDRTELRANTRFTLNVYAPDIQLGQDKGLAQSAQIESVQKWNRITDLAFAEGGTFSYTYAGESHVIAVSADTTLERLVWMINESPDNPGVKASLLNDGKGGYSLILTGNDSGAANQIKIGNDTTYGDPIWSDEHFHINRQATNAVVSLNDSGRWVQRSTNLITDLVDGASIRIKDTGTTLFNITTDHEDMADKVQAFVDEYNSILDYIDEITKVVLDEEGDANMHAAGVLVGNYAVNMLRSALRSFIGARASGFDADGDVFSLLTQVGLESNHLTRRLDFDRAEFIEALNNNERDVVRLFAADSEASISTRGFSIEPGIMGLDDYLSGNYTFNVEYTPEGKLSSVTMFDPTTNQTYTSDPSNEPREIRIAEDGMSFSIHVGGARNMIINNVQMSGSDDVKSFTVTVRDGKGKTFDEEINKLFDETTGITKVLERNYESIIKNIDKRIEREYMRVLQVKKRLEMRFARLEVNMGNWNGQMERLQQQIRSLPSGA